MSHYRKFTGPVRTLRAAPSLQKMVAHYGGYDKIPQASWDKYHAAMRQYLIDMRGGHVEIAPASLETTTIDPQTGLEHGSPGKITGI